LISSDEEKAKSQKRKLVIYDSDEALSKTRRKTHEDVINDDRRLNENNLMIEANNIIDEIFEKKFFKFYFQSKGKLSFFFKCEMRKCESVNNIWIVKVYIFFSFFPSHLSFKRILF
jgi:hypothetical protein